MSDDVRRTQVEPTAGIWRCDHCGRRIQVITESDHQKLQAFTCVCGTPMAPGEEHAPRREMQDHVVDD